MPLFLFHDPVAHGFYTLSYTTLFRSPAAPPPTPAPAARRPGGPAALGPGRSGAARAAGAGDRKSTRLNSSHPSISYAVFCLKKKSVQWGAALYRQNGVLGFSHRVSPV